jgi:hypothetical protein
MAGGLGDFLDTYLFPLAGLGALALGIWSSWLLWRPEAGDGPEPPSLAARVAAIILGGVAGWCLSILTYPRDAQSVTMGFPWPVMTLLRVPGDWQALDASASIPCLLLDLCFGVGLGNMVLHLAWHWQNKRRPPDRAGGQR